MPWAVLRVIFSFLLVSGTFNSPANARNYSAYNTWAEAYKGLNCIYQPIIRVSDPGTPTQPSYTAFWFFGLEQFDATGRYVIAMKVYFNDRDVVESDVGDIGYIGLQDGYKWTKIGTSRAFALQQGCRLQWRANSDEILWNDRSHDGTSFVCRVYNFKTGAKRVLPRPIYHASPDGTCALTHDFNHIQGWTGVRYDFVPDPYKGQRAPSTTGIWKMDLNTGNSQLVMSLERIAQTVNYTGKSPVFIFRETWNVSGSRFVAVIKGQNFNQGWTMSGDGSAPRFLHDKPSHQVWRDETTLLEGRLLTLFNDDGSGKGMQIADVGTVNFDPSYIPGQNNKWILGSTYPLADGYQRVVLYYVPTKKFVPLAKLQVNVDTTQAQFRIDPAARTSRDGRIVCIDSSYENLGRQMYIINIGHILDNPPDGSPPS